MLDAINHRKLYKQYAINRRNYINIYKCKTKKYIKWVGR
jgi:hypothetical protein